MKDLAFHAGAAHPKDLPTLVAALCEHCAWLVTFNIRHTQPGHTEGTLLLSGEFVRHVRDLPAH